MTEAPARSGDPVDAIDTPALVVDLDAMERNLAAMAAFARTHGVRLRPHAKMHKCAAIARLQLAAGAVGVCVQKVGEAEALVGAGVGDVYVSNVVVAGSKLARFAALAGRATLSIAVDSNLGVERLARALAAAGTRATVFVEVDVGHGRCGVPPAAAGALAQQVVAHGLPFGGLQAYHGSAQHQREPAARAAAIGHAAGAVRAAQAAVTATGLPCPLVTGAGTGTFVHEAASGVWNELQCGSYLFMDRDYADNQHAADAHEPVFEHALFVKSRVVSRGAAHAVIDAGHKSHALDSGPPRVWARALAWSNGGDEHGLLRGAVLPALDETVWLVPGHCDPTVNLHDHLVAVRGGLQQGRVEAVWPVDARGCLR
jgi:D-serine deaminase-like pyridoxal phosphate-dependent protein